MPEATYIRDLIPRYTDEGGTSEARLYGLSEPVIGNDGQAYDYVCLSALEVPAFDMSEVFVFPVEDEDQGYGFFPTAIAEFRPAQDFDTILEELGYEVV